MEERAILQLLSSILARFVSQFAVRQRKGNPMGIVSTLLTAAVLVGPPVEVSTFSGQEHKGELTALSGGQLTFTEEGAEKKLAVADVLELRLGGKEEMNDAAAHEILLTDGSRINAQKVSSTAKALTLEHATLGTLEIPLEYVGSIRLAPSANVVADAWTELTRRRENSDMLVIRKGDLLDSVKGGLGPISDESLQFFLAGKQNTLPRSEKLHGVVYGNRQVPKQVAISRAILSNKDSLELKSLSFDGQAFQGELLSGTKVTLPLEKLSTLDFSLGKVQFLSDIQPRRKKIVLPFYFADEPISEIDQEYYDVKVNKTFSGKPLQLGKVTYGRGLCIHSTTELGYRLSKEMRRFQAMMGIDNYTAQKGLGDVKVTMKADGKVLLETIVKAGDEPQKVDLDVSDVVVFEIIVDRAREEDLGEGDHLNLADAKFIK